MTPTLLLKVFCAKEPLTQPQLTKIINTIQGQLRAVQPLGQMNIASNDSKPSLINFCEITPLEIDVLIRSAGGVAFAEKNGIEINVGYPPTEELRYTTPTCLIRMQMGRMGWRESESLFVSLLNAITHETPCDLAFVCSESEYTHVYPSPLGIRAGLADLYWITVFGQEYVDLIGPEAFARLQVYECLKLSWGGRLIQVSESMSEASSIAIHTPRSQAKIALGEDMFFIAKKQTHATGARSFFDPRFWLTLKQNVSAAEQLKARRVPKFGN